jgi:hypothetical protein
MSANESRQAFDPALIRQWNGPVPDEEQFWLLDTCLAPLEDAQRFWWRWREQCDFIHESSVSHELASLAVLRLGERAGNCSIALRSMGFYRRSWFLSELAIKSAARIAEVALTDVGPLLVRGDLAMKLLGPTFEGRAFPVRSLKFAVAPHARGQQILLAEREKLASAMLRTDLIRIEFSRAARWMMEASQAAPDPYANLRVLPLPLMLADLVASNWRWGPPGGLRWVLELVMAMEQAPDPDALASAIVDASIRLGSVPALQATTETFAFLSAGRVFESLQFRLKGVPTSRRSRWRLNAITASPLSWQHRSLRMLNKLQSHLNG